MRIRRIQSVNLFVTCSFGEVRRFYEDALDLPFMRISDTRLEFYTGDVQLAFVQADAETQRLVGDHRGLTLRVRNGGDLARMITRLRSKGFDCFDQHFKPHRDGHRLHVQDPSGNWITLLESDDTTDNYNMFQGPSSVTVKVRDIRRAMGFYTTVLELPMQDQPDPYTAIFVPGETNLILSMRDEGWVAAKPVSGETGVVMHCDDPLAMVDNLKGMQVNFPEEPRQVGTTVLAGFEDPDGNHYLLGGPL